MPFSPMRSTGVTFVLAGLLVLIRGVMELWEPVYWQPETLFDYASAILSTVAWVVTGVGFVMWFRSTAQKRLSWLLLLAGAGLIVSGIGNLLEDVLDIGFGEVMFSAGGIVGALSVLAAGVMVLTVPGAVKWCSIFLLAFVAGAIFPDSGGQFLDGFALVGLGLWLIRVGGVPRQVGFGVDPATAT